VAKHDYDIGIIGGGAAGLTVAAGASQLGVKTLLVEREPALGGDCLHYGCVPSKTLIKTARVYHLIKNAKSFGLPDVSVGRVDFKEVARRIQSVIETIQKHDSVERFCGLGVKVEFGAPRFVDEYTVEIGGKSYSAKKWVISTGSSPSSPPLEGLDSTSYITNKEVFSLEELPSSMIVLGGGPIAIEMAQAFSRLGTDVTVIQRSPQILTKEDSDMAELIMKTLETEGVNFYTRTKLKRVSEKSGVKEVVFEHEGREKKITGEVLLIALGREANLDDLGLENTGIEYSSKGLILDERLRSTQKHIYGAGDVTGRYLFTHAAGYEGGVVIANAVFHLPKKVNYRFIPRCTYTDPELACIGLTERDAEREGIDYTVWKEKFSSNDRALAEGETTGLIKLLVDRKGHPLGVQILGLHAGELLSEWVAAMNGGIKLSALASSVHPYPTLSEINKRVAGNLLSSKLFSDRVRKTLRFFFHFKGRACGSGEHSH
jgi:pyruvate/2-oxoglutarate dehydrogenase complex dihydrolipoamide dehydrogenase (E3) component